MSKYWLPAAFLFPATIGMAQWAAQRAGYLSATSGIVFTALAGSFLFSLITLAMLKQMKQAEQEQRLVDEKASELHERYRLIFSSSPLALGISTPAEGRIIDVNRSFLRMFEYHRDEVIGHTSMDLGLWESPQSRASILNKLNSDPHIHNFECLFFTRHRTALEVLVTVDLIEMRNEKYFIWIINDITKRKLNEEKIRDLIQLLNEAQDAICVRDMENRIQYWNSGAERLFGWPAEEILGRDIIEPMYGDRASFDIVKEATITTGKWQGEIQLADQNGKSVIVNSRCTLAFDNTGNPKSILTIYTDITERKQFEAQLLRAQRMESIGTLAGGIAHDLNNILAPILMSIPLLKDATADEEIRNVISIVDSSAQRAANIIQQLLTFARGMEKHHSILSPKCLLNDIHKLIEATFPKSFQFEMAHTVNPWKIEGDPTQLQQVLLNLCVNARDAMPEGGLISLKAENIRLDASAAKMHPGAHAGPYVAITIKDSGIGIPSEHLEKIFDPFFTTKDVGKGTGLGLSVVVGIVKNHGGFITVQSELKRGSSFTIYLPAAETDSCTTIPANKSKSPHGRNELILIVDDEEPIRTMMRRTLICHGYRVMAAASGTEALFIFTEHQNDFSAVITDMMMPNMDGRATICGLRKIKPNIGIIAASGLLQAPLLDPASTDLIRLPKPFTTEQLLQAVSQVVSKAQSHAT